MFVESYAAARRKKKEEEEAELKAAPYKFLWRLALAVGRAALRSARLGQAPDHPRLLAPVLLAPGLGPDIPATAFYKARPGCVARHQYFNLKGSPNLLPPRAHRTPHIAESTNPLPSARRHMTENSTLTSQLTLVGHRAPSSPIPAACLPPRLMAADWRPFPMAACGGREGCAAPRIAAANRGFLI